jgi:type 1 fimbriae regulatory protein FimB
LLLAYRHGLRASEVALLQLADLDLAQYRLRVHRRRNSLSGVHPLQPDEVKIRRAYLRTRNGNNLPVLFPSRFDQPSAAGSSTTS